MTKTKKTATYIAKASNSFFDVIEGMIVTDAVVKFRNGEHHVIGMCDGKKVELPLVFFNEVK